MSRLDSGNNKTLVGFLKEVSCALLLLNLVMGSTIAAQAQGSETSLSQPQTTEITIHAPTTVAEPPSSSTVPLLPVGQVREQENPPLSKELGIPLYMWDDGTDSPKAIIVAFHGLTFHGKVYKELGKRLAQDGYLVVAPEMRGYGRWYYCSKNGGAHTKDCGHVTAKTRLPKITSLPKTKENKTTYSQRVCKRANYKQSLNDFTALLKRLHQEYPGLMLYCIGESLGADMAVRLASTSGQLVDGLILASPAIKKQGILRRSLIPESAKMMFNPAREINVRPYLENCLSEDKRIVNERAQDPYVRKGLSLLELLSTQKTTKETLTYIPNISPNTPVLIIQGTDDRIIKANGVVLILERLRAKDQTVRWFDNRGHVLLETAYIQPDTWSTITDWLTEHLAAASNKKVQSGIQTALEVDPKTKTAPPVEP
jgi:alpha-beta hydrolase superfamily lysophospholipase